VLSRAVNGRTNPRAKAHAQFQATCALIESVMTRDDQFHNMLRTLMSMIRLVSFVAEGYALIAARLPEIFKQ
jgi:hypothetical protein